MKKIGLICIILFFAQASYAGETKYCYLASDDKDHDGYAKKYAQEYEVRKPDGSYCPSGYLLMAQDCNDSDPNIHPFQPEVPGNFKDDNCNNKTDEVEVVYDDRVSTISSDSVRLNIKVNSYGEFILQVILFMPKFNMQNFMIQQITDIKM